MHELSTTMSETIPYLYPDPAQDSKGLTEKVKRLHEITQQLEGDLKHGVNAPDSDPATPYLTELLRNDIERAYLGAQEGHAEYAKTMVRTSVSYCIACHTRTQTGPEFPLLSAFTEPLKRASWIDKIEFQAASRQFDPVLDEVTKQLGLPKPVGLSPLDLERATRIALAVAIRVKQDPLRAQALAEAVSRSPSASFAMKESAKVWLKDLARWKKEKIQKYDSDSALIQVARRLVKAADSDRPMGGYAEVEYLRASVLMHDLLRRYPKSRFVPEALYIVGLSYDSLRDLGLWSMNEMYYFACIEKAPHTRQAELCFRKYDDSITIGYSGSSGIHIPQDVRLQLEKLRKTAEVIK